MGPTDPHEPNPHTPLGTGNIKDVGSKTGKYYSVNVPLEEGIDDA